MTQPEKMSFSERMNDAERLLDACEEATNAGTEMETDTLEQVMQALTATLSHLSPDMLEEERQRLDRLVERLRHFASYLGEQKAHIRQELEELEQSRRATLAYTKGNLSE